MNMTECRQPITGLLLALSLLAGAGGCSTAAREGATQGAAMGFVGGVAAGAVHGLLFGGSAWEGAVEGGLAGAAGGAAMGGMQGGMANKQATQQAQASGTISEKDIAAFRKEQGDLNFQAVVYLAQCQHADAMTTANRALENEKKTERKVFALTVRAVAELETGDRQAAEATYAAVAATDPERSVDRARADVLEARLRLQGIRRDNNIAPCGN